MGMDLKPVQPTPDAPRYPKDDKYDPDGHVWGRYNWTGWSMLIEKLNAWGVATEQFKHFNDGDTIPADKCAEVADAIETHLPELDADDRAWLEPHIKRWRTCGGYQQY